MAFKVGDDFRTNKLSLKPGGSTVTIYFSVKEPRIYDKIKNPVNYIKSLLKRPDNGIIKVDVDGKEYWKADGIQGKLL